MLNKSYNRGENMKAIYTSMKEVAELYNSEEKDYFDLKVLVKICTQSFIVKHGENAAKNVIEKHRTDIKTVTGLEQFLKDMNVDEIRMYDSVTGYLDCMAVYIK